VLPRISWRARAIILALLAVAAVLLVVFPDGSSAARPVAAGQLSSPVTDYAGSVPGARYAARLQHAERLSAIRASKLRAARLAARRAAARKAAREASAARQDAGSSPSAPTGAAVVSGALSPAQVGAYWLAAGGSRAAEATAECIAWHESSDVPSKISPTDDWGLWQINAGNAGMQAGSTTIVISRDPLANARDAVALSRDGTDWSDWTTHADCGV